MPYKDKEKNREYQRLWRYRDHEKSLNSERKSKARIRKKYLMENKCRDCGIPLIHDEKVRCINCISETFRMEVQYAKDSMRLAKII
jgi:transposase